MISTYPAIITPTILFSPLTVGEETFHREFAASSNLVATTQTMKLTFFTARKTEITSQARLSTGGVAAVTPTWCQIGLYTIDASGAGALVASCANDTTLFVATSTIYTKAWTTPYVKVAGQRYAFAHLVLATTMPTWIGHALGVNKVEYTSDPRITGSLPSQSSLPSTFTNAALSNNVDGRTYGVILP